MASLVRYLIYGLLEIDNNLTLRRSNSNQRGGKKELCCSSATPKPDGAAQLIYPRREFRRHAIEPMGLLAGRAPRCQA